MRRPCRSNSHESARQFHLAYYGDQGNIRAPFSLPQTPKKTPFSSRPISAKQLDVSPAPAKLNPPAVVVAIFMVASFSMKSPPKPCASSLKSLRTSLGLLHSMSTDTVPGLGGPSSVPLDRLLGTVLLARTPTF